MIHRYYGMYSRYARLVICVITRVKRDANGAAGTLHTVIPIRGRRPPPVARPLRACSASPRPPLTQRYSPVPPGAGDGVTRLPAGAAPSPSGQHPRQPSKPSGQRPGAAPGDGEHAEGSNRARTRTAGRSARQRPPHHHPYPHRSPPRHPVRLWRDHLRQPHPLGRPARSLARGHHHPGRRPGCNGRAYRCRPRGPGRRPRGASGRRIGRVGRAGGHRPGDERAAPARQGSCRGHGRPGPGRRGYRHLDRDWPSSGGGPGRPGHRRLRAAPCRRHRSRACSGQEAGCGRRGIGTAPPCRRGPGHPARRPAPARRCGPGGQARGARSQARGVGSAARGLAARGLGGAARRRPAVTTTSRCPR